MATVRDHVRVNLGETYLKLVGVGYDAQEKPDVVSLKTGAILSRVFLTETLEADLSEFSRSFIALGVSLAMIPLAIDYYMVNTRRNENMGRPAGVTPLGGETIVNYDRVDALIRLDQILKDAVAEQLADFLAENAGNVSPTQLKAGARVSSDGKFRTDDPYDTFFTPRAATVSGGEFGVFWGIVPDQPFVIDLS